MSHKGLELEDPANEPSLDRMLKMTVAPEEAPDKAEYVEDEFEKGLPVAVNGKKMAGVELIYGGLWSPCATPSPPSWTSPRRP